MLKLTFNLILCNCSQDKNPVKDQLALSRFPGFFYFFLGGAFLRFNLHNIYLTEILHKFIYMYFFLNLKFIKSSAPGLSVKTDPCYSLELKYFIFLSAVTSAVIFEQILILCSNIHVVI